MKKSDKLKNMELANRKLLSESEGEENEKMTVVLSGEFEIRSRDMNTDGNLFYSLYLNGKQIGPNVVQRGGFTTGSDFVEVIRKLLK